MLKKSLRNSLPWAIALGLMAVLPMSWAEAALFEQQDVDPEKFVAIAVPLPQGDRYNLIILEQQSDAQPCWEEDTETGTIEPLLLTFDFSGICGRSTDSNGYSIRQVGEDLALKYRLSLRKQDGVLILMGVPLKASYGKPMEIGRTQSLKDEFLKVTLNPDWRFTRRTYQGKALGHIYLTRDVIPPEPEEIEETDDTNPSPEESDELAIADATQDRTGDSLEESSDEDLSEDSSKDSASATIQPLSGPVEIPVPTPQAQAIPRSTSLPVTDAPLDPLSPIPVPTIAPLGRIGASEPDVFSSGDLGRLPPVSAAGDPPPPAFNVALAIKRYRVFVSQADAGQSDIIKALAPDAFWTSHQGQRVLQLGAFEDKAKADSMIQELGQQGINGIIDAAPY